MPAAWPPSVPRRFSSNVEQTGPTNAFLLSQFDKGPPIARPNTYSGVRPIPLMLFALTNAQADAFEAWFRADLGNGALEFEMEHPLNGGIATFRFIDPGNAYSRRRLNANTCSINLSLAEVPK